MKGNCPNCPVNMDPPRIAINMTEVGQPSLFAYYCKWECASKDVSVVLNKLAGGMTPAEYDVPEAETKKPVYEQGVVWTSPDPFHHKVVEHTSPTAILAANLLLKLEAGIKKQEKFGGLKTAVVGIDRDKKTIVDLDGQLYLCPVSEVRTAGMRLFDLIAGPEKVFINFITSNDQYNLALDPVQFSVDDDADRILTHIDTAVMRLWGGRGITGYSTLQVKLPEEPATATIPAQPLHVAGGVTFTVNTTNF